jgi:hypothetical protein
VSELNGVARGQGQGVAADLLSAQAALARAWVRALGRERQNVPGRDVGWSHRKFTEIQNLEQPLRELSMKRDESLEQFVPIVDELGGVVEHHASELELDPANPMQQGQRPTFVHPKRSIQRFNHKRLTSSRRSDESHFEPVPRSHNPRHWFLDSLVESPIQSYESISRPKIQSALRSSPDGTGLH